MVSVEEQIIKQVIDRDKYIVNMAEQGLDAVALRANQRRAIIASIATTKGITFEVATAVSTTMGSTNWSPEDKLAFAAAMADVAGRSDNTAPEKGKTRKCQE